MQLNVTIPDTLIERIVKSIMENCPEASQSMRCLKYKYEDWIYKFQDYEDGAVYTLDKAKLLATFPLLYTEPWRKCKGLKQPLTTDNEADWDEWLGNFDGDNIDGFIQMAIFGEVIYG